MTTQETAPAEWSFAKRMGFRFVFSYFVLYYIPFPLDLIPFTGKVWTLWARFWEHLVIWTGAHVLHLAQPITYQPTGSGDTMHDYVLVFISLVIAVAAAAVWPVLDRRRSSYFKLAGWMRVYLRYALAAIMLGYGFSKVFDLQFSPPGPSTLMETYGASSPMGLAWTFMGYSVAYTVFAGAMECLGGILLLFRRTATLGAMVTAAVMVNVVMMNFCFDIPVKLYSVHLLLTAFVILGPSFGRLVDVLIFHRQTEPEDIRPPQWTGWRKWGRLSIKALLISYVMLFANIKGNWEMWKMGHAPKGPLEGAYEVESFRRNRVEVPPLVTDASRWRAIVVYPRVVAARGMDDKGKFFGYQADLVKGTLDLIDRSTPEPPKTPEGSFRLSWPDPDHLLLQGTFDGAPLEVLLKKKDASDFPLMKRGFHWINEMPYNR